MEFKFHLDGSFDLTAGDLRLMRCYPAIDGVPVRPLRAEAGQRRARYELDGGALEIYIEEEQDLLALHCRVEGLQNAHDIMPIANACIEGCDRGFAQGLGMGGPSGFFKLDDTEHTSHSMLAVGREYGCIAIYARAQHRLHNVSCVKGNRLSVGFDTECVPLDEDELPVLYIRSGRSYSDVMRAGAKEISETMHARPVTKPAFHWCSWYYLYHTLDQKTLEEYLEGFSQYRDIAPFSHIQIDAGYFPSCGDWLDRYERFPQGLKHAADTIRAAGYEPGIWIGPFMVGDNSRLYREHPDWMLRTVDGGHVHPWIQYNEPKPWGYRDSDYFVLDTSHPDAMNYLRQVFTTLREWGYTLFKTDFLNWGLQDSSKVVRHTPGKTSFEYLRDVMRMIRECIGEDSRWLGCIAPFMPAVGFVDMMRISGDISARWEESGFGPDNMLQELYADQYFNNVYWQNDPDAILIRDFHTHLTAPQVEALSLMEAMSGGTVYTSAPIHLISDDRRQLLNFIRPNKLQNAEYPFWSEMREEICVIQRLQKRSLIYFFNETNRTIIKPYDWKALLGDGVKYLRKYHGECVPVEEIPFVTIPPRSGILYFATAEPLEADPANLWEE